MLIDSMVYSGKCSCGREHTMVTRAAIIEAGAMLRFEQYMSQYGISGKRCALYDTNTYAAVGERRPDAEQVIILNPENLHANEISTAEVLDKLESDVEVIIALGSGTIHDIARFCAHERGIRFVACPTGASVDGFCSTVAAMTWHGYKKTLPAVAPEIVIADTEIIRDAPHVLVKSGVGDILAKYTALADWKIAHILTGEYYCDNIADLTAQAVEAVRNSIEQLLAGDTDAYANVTYALIMSGLAMQLMGNSRPASGSEHHISHIIEMQPDSLNVAFYALHGEKTGVGTVEAVREYKRLASIEDIAPFVTDYKPVTEQVIRDYYGRLADSIIEENKNDCLAELDKNTLIEKWQEVRKIIGSLPSVDELYGILESLDAKRSPEDIGVTQDDRDAILRYSPLVRNRLTLMRVRRMLNA